MTCLFSKPLLINTVRRKIVSSENVSWNQTRTKYMTSGIDKESYLNKKSVKNYIGGYAVCLAIVPATCFGLAIWQIKRKQWKDELLRDLKLKPLIPVIDLPEDLSNRKKLEYRRVRVKGTFDHSREMYMGPCGRIEDGDFVSSGSFVFSNANIADHIGYYVITPFKLSDRNLEILVNRGWVHTLNRDPNTRLEGQIEGEVELEGVVRMKEDKPNFASKEHHNVSRVFRFRDITNMADLENTSFLFIDAVKESTVPGGPIGGQTHVNIRNEHLNYIITWLMLGSWTGYMWFKKCVQKVM